MHKIKSVIKTISSAINWIACKAFCFIDKLMYTLIIVEIIIFGLVLVGAILFVLFGIGSLLLGF